MIVLHAIWESPTPGTGKLHIWAETSSQTTTAPKRTSTKSTKRQTQAKEQNKQPHPFVLAHRPLMEVIEEYLETPPLNGMDISILTLRLPSTAKGPQPSPELILEHEDEDLRQPSGFQSWDVASLALHPQLALDFLLGLPHEPPHGVAFGSSLRFWTEAAKFSYELLTRQCFAPTLQETKRGNVKLYRAVWETVLAGEDDERMYQLATMMPPVCWSHLPPNERSSSVPQSSLRHFLNHTIDAFVRESLSEVDLLPVGRSSRRTPTVSLQEQWLQALTAHDATLTASPQELQTFSSAMQEWLGQLRPVAANAAFRTCFRLDPPSESEKDGSAWHVGYYLQANDDRSLLVPADTVWKERSGTLTFLKRQFENPQERLLTDLGKASRLFPTIEESLKTARPKDLALTTEEAYKFLRESVPLLEQSGFGVLVPPWWNKPAARLRVKLKVKPKANVKTDAGLFGLNSIVDYNWQVAVGDTTLSVKEFEKLVNLKMPLIQVRGQWVELRPEEIEAAIAFFQKKQGNGNMTLGEALRLGLGQEQSEVGLQVADIEYQGWIKEVMDKLTDGARVSSIEPPSNFHGKLRPYQLKGVSWMAFLKQFGFGSCLADDMGLGKCISADSLIIVNGALQKSEDIWSSYAGNATFDSEGYWANPTEPLLTNSIDETTGQIVQALIKRLYRQQVSERLRKVRLEDGSSVTITYPHKLLTDKGWTNELHEGDYICVPAKLIWDGKPEDPDLVKFLAWQIAEGYEARSPTALTVTQKDTLVLEDLLSCLERLSEKYGIKINCPSIMTPGNKSAYLRITSVDYRHFLETRGYEWGKLSREKRIPDFIMQADLASVRIFLSNFFEAEAAVVSSMRSIEIATASPLLIQQLSHLLRRFGIWMRISTKQKRATNGTGIFRPYQIGVLGGNAARKFCREMGFIDKQLLSTTRVKLQYLIDQEVYYCRIKDIEDVQYEGWVYDFEVENHHNFVADNILCHNTVQLITLLLHDLEQAAKQNAARPNPTLLVCPMSIVGNWHRELQRFAPSLSVLVHHGAERLSDQAFLDEAKKHDVVITTYALALRDKEHLSLIDWEYVVVDEAQNIKNETAKQTRAIKSIPAKYKIALTGTPVENRLSELWSIMEFLNPNYLGSGQEFRKSFAIPIEKYHDANRAETLKRLIQPFVLRRLKTDKAIIQDLPDKMEMKVFCNLTQEQASLYEAVVKEMIEKIEQAEGIERKGLVLSTLLKLKQICNHPAHFMADSSSLPGRSGKLARLEEMLLEALSTGDKALIFTQFAEMGTMLRQYLQEALGCEVLFLYGGTPKKQRDAMVQRFQEDRRGAPIFLLSLKAGGVGLNLTAANHVFHFDRWWNPAVENQATDRAFRIGQHKNVQVHKFVCVGTLEERIDQMIEQKKELAESIVGSGENWLTEMSTTQLKELFALSREAVGE